MDNSTSNQNITSESTLSEPKSSINNFVIVGLILIVIGLVALVVILLLTNRNNQSVESNSQSQSSSSETDMNVDEEEVENETSNNSMNFSSLYFSYDFEYPVMLGEALSDTSRTNSTGSTALFCLTESITFSESDIEIKLTKGAMECAGAGGREEELSRATVNDMRGNEYTLITFYRNSDQSYNLTASFASSSDMNRTARITFKSSTENEVNDVIDVVKNLIELSSLDDTSMRNEAVL